MTKTQITRYTTLLCSLVLLAGTSFALASEVTGTLSSDTASKAAPSGNISGSVTNEPVGNIGGTVTTEPGGSLGGTVTSQPAGSLSGTVTSGGTGGSSGGSSGGGGSSSSGGGSGGSTADTSDGSVLGASIDNLQTPAFPNAGFAPTEHTASQTMWSGLAALLGNLLTF